MAVGFDLISASINTPGVFVEFDNSRAVSGTPAMPHVVLLTGQMLTGSATAGQIYAVANDAEAVVLFGAKSQLRQMVKAFKDANPLVEVFCCACAVDSGTAATGSITWTGTATEGGELPLYIGGRRVAVPVVNGDDAAAVEVSALAALALVDSDLPVSYAGNASTGVDFTSEQEGTIGNQIRLGVALLAGERVPAGLSVTVTPMSSGATDPSYAGVITAMGEDQYNTVAVGLASSTALGLFVTELESRWGPMRAIEGQAIAAFYDSRANLTTLGNGFNSHALSLVGAEANALLPLPWELAAQTAAIDARQATVDPARALTGLSYTGFTAASRGSRFTRAERDILLSDGVSTVYAGSDGRLRLERLITTWQTNAQALPDESYKDQTTVRLLAALRFSVRARISSRFARYKLVSDSTVIPPGQPMTNPRGIRSEMINLFGEWQDSGWVEGLDQFKAELLVERDVDAGGSDPNRVNILLPPDLVNNLLVTAVKMSYKR